MRPTLRENSPSPSTWRTSTITRRNPPEIVTEETSSLQSGCFEGAVPPVRRRRFGSACLLPSAQQAAKKRRGSMGRGRPNVIRFRSASAGSLQLDSPSTIPDLTGSSSSSMDDYYGGGSSTTPRPISPLQPHDTTSRFTIIHEKTPDLEPQRLIKRWTRSLLLIVSHATRTTTAVALNGLLDILFWVLSTIFAILETTAVLIQENQLLKWIGNTLIRVSAVLIHSTRRKRPVSQQHPQQPLNRKTHPESPGCFRRRPRQSVESSKRSCPNEAKKRHGEPVKRGLFRRKPKAPSEAL